MSIANLPFTGIDQYDFRLGADVNYLAAVAVSRLQGELAKDGSQLSAAFKGMQGKSFPAKAAIVKSSEKKKGKNFLKSLIVPFDVSYKNRED